MESRAECEEPMDTWALGVVLLSALMHAIWNFFAKQSRDKFVFSWWMKLFELLIYSPLSVYLLLVSDIARDGWIFVWVSGAIHFTYWVLLSASYTHGDLSVVYPLARSAPLFVSVFAVLVLGETLSAVGIVGILAVVLGGYILAIGSLEVRELRRPSSSLRDKGVILAVLTALSVTAYSLVDKQGAAYVHPVLYVWLENTLSLLPLTLVILHTRRQRVSAEWRENKWPMILGGGLGLLSYALIVLVMQSFQVSYIVAIRQVSIVFGVVFGGTILKEENMKSRLIASTLVFAGLVLISLS
jgi:drug/metabolite transporter (DMT)-like permease